MHGKRNQYRIYDDAQNKVFESCATKHSAIIAGIPRVSKSVWPDQFGTFDSCHITVAKGIRIAFENMTSNQNLTIRHSREEPDHVIGSFFLNGDFRMQCKDHSQQVATRNTGIVWSHTPGVTYTSLLKPKQRSRAAYIIIKPEVFNSLKEYDDGLRNGLWDLFTGKREGTCTAGHLAADDHRLLQEIFCVNPDSPWDWLRLESKVLELLGNSLSRYGQVGSSKSGIVMPPHDIARIEAARDILIENMDNPPSIIKLARLAGINEFKLKKGFKQLYSDTVYGYLRRHRLETAYRLLKSGEMNVTEVATKIGFTNASAFAAAFKKEFGVNPAECRRKYFSI